jgi:hypothetical protein
VVPSKPLISTLALALAASACPAVGTDRGDTCTDIGSLRACWAGATAGIVPRLEPKLPPASVMGWRCVGGGAERRCVDRALTAAGFACNGASCEQRHPRMPDDGEWRCTDSGGATVCAGGQPAAGVAPAAAEPGWLCGQRRGSTPPERVCVDLSPDFPDGNMDGWRCRTLYDGPLRRVCDREAPGRTLTAPCDAGRPCVDGSRCVDGRCIPDRPAPSCVLQTDCASGRCRFGSCQAEGA